MPLTKKHLLVVSSLAFTTGFLIVSTTSCLSKTNSNSSDLKDIEDFIKSIQVKLKDNKKDLKSTTLASTINTEEQVKEWFDGLPESNNEIKVKFVSASPLSIESQTLKVIYEISKGTESKNFEFEESGFKKPESDKEIVDDFISKIQKPTLKPNKQSEKANTLASSINSENKVEEWFDNLPKSQGDITVTFESAKEATQNSPILVVKYKVSKNTYSSTYEFTEDGFKIVPEESLKDFGDFSLRNSFKVEFQITPLPEGGGSYLTTGGTAWSWYYKKHSEYQYDWYLMTNLHVVNNAVSFINNFGGMVTNPSGLIEWYKNNQVTKLPPNYIFYLSKWTENNNYKVLATTSKNINDDLAVKPESIKNVEIITDFNNDSVDLFSKSDESGKVLYNMDMALIKFEFDFSSRPNHLQESYKRPNVFATYESEKQKWIDNKFNDNQNIFVGGHPSAQNKLIYYEFTPPFDIEYGLLNYNDRILELLKAPYFHSKNWVPDYKLTEGASGSAIYQKLLNQSFSWSNIVPIGIYWGGLAPYDGGTEFKPSLIPFIVDRTFTDTLDKKEVNLQYNIYDNFAKYIANK